MFLKKHLIVALGPLLIGLLAASLRADILYVSSADNNTIVKFNSAGVGSVFASAGLVLPYGLAFDSAANLYVANQSASSILKIAPGGTVSGFATTGLNNPLALAIDRAGNVYAANYGNSTIARITPGGVSSVFVASGVVAPAGLAFDSAGNLYVTNFFGASITKITPGGATSVFAENLGDSPYGLAFDAAGNLYVSKSGGEIARFTPGGVGSIFASGGRLNAPRGLAFDSAGNLYVVNRNGNNVVKFSPTGADLGVFASTGLASPEFIAFTTDAGVPLPLPPAAPPALPTITTQPIPQTVAPGASATFTVGATNATSFQWRFNNTAIPGATLTSYTIASVTAANAGDYSVVVSNGAGSVTSNAVTLTVSALPPTIISSSFSRTVVAGTSVTFTVATINATSFQWLLNNTAIPGATLTSYTIASATAADAGNYILVASNGVGSVTSLPLTLTVTAPPNPGRIANMSIRSTAGSGAQTLIVGVVIGGAGTSGTKPLLIRGIGPALTPFGVPGALADPTLSVFAGTSVVASNDNWNGDVQVTVIGNAVGAFGLAPATSRDAALYAPALAARDYTIQVTGVGNTTGIALAEIYDATLSGSITATTPQLINVSARTQVGTGADILIAGFTIDGTTARSVLIRAVGPTLGGFGVTGVLADPQLRLFTGTNQLQENNDWGAAANAAQVTVTTGQLGTFQLGAGSRDSAILTVLQPGSYTVQVSGVGNTTGVALVEIYLVP